MTGKGTDGVSWGDRDDLTSWEKEAVSFYLKYSREVQHYLRQPREIAPLEEWSYFEALITHLDRVIARSTPIPGTLVYRGVTKDFTSRLVFLLSLDPGVCGDKAFHPITPQIIQDPGYSLFTRDPGRLTAGPSEGTRVFFVHRTESSDRALDIGGSDRELMYPRGSLWMATGYGCTTTGGTTTLFIALESFFGGGHEA